MQVARYFQKRADQFDALYDGSRWLHGLDRLLRRGLYERTELTLEELRGWQDCTVLDVGCGSGRNSVLFAEAGAKRVVGIDFSDRMIELATNLSRTRGVAQRCEFLTGDFLTYPLAGTCDAVVALGVFDYVAEPAPFLQRMMERATRKVIASFPCRSLIRAPLRKLRYRLKHCPLYFTTENELKDLCRKVGLSSFRLVPYASSGLLLVGEVGTQKERAGEGMPVGGSAMERASR